MNIYERIKGLREYKHVIIQLCEDLGLKLKEGNEDEKRTIAKFYAECLIKRRKFIMRLKHRKTVVAFLNILKNYQNKKKTLEVDDEMRSDLLYYSLETISALLKRRKSYRSLVFEKERSKVFLRLGKNPKMRIKIPACYCLLYLTRIDDDDYQSELAYEGIVEVAATLFKKKKIELKILGIKMLIRLGFHFGKVIYDDRTYLSHLLKFLTSSKAELRLYSLRLVGEMLCTSEPGLPTELMEMIGFKRFKDLLNDEDASVRAAAFRTAGVAEALPEEECEELDSIIEILKTASRDPGYLEAVLPALENCSKICSRYDQMINDDDLFMRLSDTLTSASSSLDYAILSYLVRFFNNHAYSRKRAWLMKIEVFTRESFIEVLEEIESNRWNEVTATSARTLLSHLNDYLLYYSHYTH